MNPPANDIVCIDVDDAETRLCKWDGAAILVERGDVRDVSTAISQGLRRLAPRQRYGVRYRVERKEPAASLVSQEIETAARAVGAMAVRRLPLDVRADPGLTAARQAADRHRLGDVICLECRKATAQWAVLDVRGNVTACERANRVDVDGIVDLLRRAGGSSAAMIGYGSGLSVETAVSIAERCGFRQVLIPEYAESLAVVGMLIVDLVVNLRMDVPAGATDSRRLREGFARLMDEAARQATQEGYDIDDTVCERIVEGTDGEHVAFEAYLQAPFAVRALQLRVVIHTPKFALPRGEEAERMIDVNG